MNKGRVGENRESKETDGCPLTEKFFLDYGFTCLQVYQAVYFRRNVEEHTIITVSVDDMAVTSKCLQDIERFKAELRERFNISDLGELTWLLGLNVE
jgi:hypothetical protein